MNQIETQCIPINKIHTPEIIITHTPKWLLDSIIDMAKKYDNNIQEPIIVIKDGSKYCIIDKFELYEAALSIKQKTIRISISHSKYTPLVAHIIATSKAKINPIRKIRAIRLMLADYNANDLLAKTLRLDAYYSLLLGISYTSKIESMLEKILDHAISIGITNTEPQIKFFEIIAASKHPVQIIQNIYLLLAGCNKSNFLWSTIIAEITDEPKKKIGQNLPHDRDFKCTCGIHYLIRDNNKAEIMLETKKYLQIMSAEGDVSHPINYIPEKLSKYIGSPEAPASFRFTSLDDAAKKFKGQQFKVIVLANREEINE